MVAPIGKKVQTLTGDIGYRQQMLTGKIVATVEVREETTYPDMSLKPVVRCFYRDATFLDMMCLVDIGALKEKHHER